MNWRCAAVSLLLASGAEAQPLSRGPYVVDATSVSVKVCWRQGSRDDYCRKIAGVPPGAAFKYQLPGIQGEWLAKTLPPAGQPARFAVFGDSGAGSKVQDAVARVLEAAKVQFVLLTGDIVYPAGADASYDERYFGVYRGLLTGLAFFPAVGNHDYGNAWIASRGQAAFDDGYRRVFQRPKYYSFDAGPVHFASIDTNEAFHTGGAEPIGAGSEQLAWLERDLAAASAPWKVVFMHVPLYSTRKLHGDNAWLRKQLQPVLEKHGAQLVFAGHDHTYERSKPISGVTYVTVGTGGSKVHGSGKTPEWLAKEAAVNGLAVVDADESRLSLTFYDAKGESKDGVTLVKTAPQPVWFRTNDGFTIAGLYRPPLDPDGRVAMLVHGVGAGKGEWDSLAQELWNRGLGTLALDLRGHGESSGDWKTFDAARSWPRAEDDLAAALLFLAQKGVPASRVGVVGGSIGANLASRLAKKTPDMPFCVLLSPGADYRGVAPAELKNRRVLVAASEADAYSYKTARSLAPRLGWASLWTREGHGAQMLREPEFFARLVDWIAASP